MGRDSGSLIGGKRSRPADDEAFFDNFHNHKRYLTEVMATSLNGLRVGESTSQSQRSSPPMDMVSPAHTETAGLSRSASSFPTSHGDDLSTLDSPMSDDSDESVGFRMGRAMSENPQAVFLPVSTLESVSVAPTSPVSPQRKEHFPPHIPNYSLSSRQQTPPPYTPSLPLPCAQARVKGTDAEGRLPPSPSDPCQSADLRRAALLRSLQIRSQSPIRPASSTMIGVPEKGGAEKGVEGLEEGGDQSSPDHPAATEHTGCNCEEISVVATTTLFSPISTRAATRVRSLLLDEPVVAATMALSTQSIIQDTESSDTGAQESRFEPKSSQPKSLLRSCSKLARSMSSDVIVSDAESKPLRSRPPGIIEKTSCKRAKPL